MSEQLVITATRPVRALRMIDVDILCHRTGEYIEKGAEVVLGEPELLEYEHIQQIVLPSLMKGEKFWVLVAEMALGKDVLRWVEEARSKQLAEQSRHMSMSEAQFFLELRHQAEVMQE